MDIFKVFFFHIPCILFLGCGSINDNDQEKPLVTIGDKVLYSSVIKQLLPEGTSSEDSAAIIKGYIENWVRDHLIISEAEKNIPPDLNLNKLVSDYRSSLLMYNFENQIINNMLDTTVTQEQKIEFYREYGSQFILSHKIVKSIVVSSAKKDRSLQSFMSKHGKLSTKNIIQESQKKGFNVNIHGEKWIPAEDIRSFVPSINPAKFKNGYSEIFSYGNKVFFIKIMELYKENEIPPLDYIDEKVEQVILNNRKTQLLKSIREELYMKNLEAGNIKYH